MLFIPFPFVVAILLIVLWLAVVRRDSETPHNLPFQALILVAATQSILSGVRWGYGVHDIRFVAPVLAATVPVLAYAGVSRLVRKPQGTVLQRIAVNAVPAMIMLGLTLFWRDLIDGVLVLIFVGYACAILWLIRPGADALRLAPFEGSQTAYRAIVFAAGFLLLTAVMDVIVFLDFTLTRGAYAISIITAGNLGGLVFLSVAAAWASRSHVPVERDTTEQNSQTIEDKEVIAAINAFMTTKHVYRDPELNLDRLARKTGITARQISSAINRATGANVSQYVNGYRISDACTLLSETNRPVTEIMFDVGFQTKSNFNREFKRVTEMSPLQWRETSTS